MHKIYLLNVQFSAQYVVPEGSGGSCRAGTEDRLPSGRLCICLPQ